MYSNISGKRISSSPLIKTDIVNTFNREMNNTMQLIGILQKENDKLRNAVKAFGRNQKSTDRLVEQNNILIQKMAEQHAKDVKDEKQRRFLVEQERDQLRKELEMWKEREQQSRLYLVDQNAKLLQQNNQLQTEMQKLRDKPQEQRRSTQQQRLTPLPPTGPSAILLRTSAQQQKPKEEQQQPRVNANNTQIFTKGRQMQNFQDGNISGKFVFVCFFRRSSYLSSNNVEFIFYGNNNLNSLVHNISSYKKELLVWTGWEFMNTTSGYADHYANLLSLCRQWKTLRPDGEIHCIYFYEKGESPSEPDKELVSLLTTCDKFLLTDYASGFTAFRQYWPKFADSILSEETKKKYPN